MSKSNSTKDNATALKRGDIYLILLIALISAAGIIIPKLFPGEAGNRRIAIIRHGDRIVRKIELDKVKEALRIEIPGDYETGQEEDGGKDGKAVSRIDDGVDSWEDDRIDSREDDEIDNWKNDVIDGWKVDEINIRKDDGTDSEIDGENNHEIEAYGVEHEKEQKEDYRAVVLVENGRIRFEESNCPDKTCVKTGWLDKPGDSAVCLPGRFMIKIEGIKDEVDGVTY